MTVGNGPPPLVDTHAHLDDPRLSGDLPGILARAREAGVAQVVAIATTASDSARVVALAGRHPGVFAAVGIHPNDAAAAADDDWERIRGLARGPVSKVVALGETGLDRYWDATPFDLQRAWFARHLALAHELELPVVIHSRDCMPDILDHLRALDRPVRGVLHSFTGTPDEAEALVAMGIHVSFAGMLTFANKALDGLRDAAARVPLDRLLVETDSPYLSPHPHRGKVNEPARVALTAARLAELRGITLRALAEATTANALRLFALPAEEIA